MSESCWSHSTIQAHVKHQNETTPSMLYIIKAAVTIQMWRMNSPTPTSLSHINHLVTLYGFHICRFLFMSTLSSIITMKRSACLNPAVKPDWSHVNCQTRDASSDHKCCATYCCFKSQTNLSLPSLVPSKVIWPQFVIKETSRKRAASAGDRLLFCVLHFFTFSLVAVTDF